MMKVFGRAGQAKTLKALMGMDTKAILDMVLKEPLIVDVYVKMEIFRASNGEIYARIIDFGLPVIETKGGKKTVKLKKGVLRDGE